MSLRIHGNRSLKTLPGETTRPTPARVREALFNIWLGEIEGCRWLDLCAGSGAMGAEALSRGAFEVVGIDQWGKACGVIQQNWQQVAKPEQQFQVLRGDVLKRLPSLAGKPFDRIYFDPPYASDLYNPVLEAIAQLQLLGPQGEMAVECDRQRPAPKTPASLELTREKPYGNTLLRFYTSHQS
ncbi:16S rRNA (guanine(966)-N(2))-methyltransferase RsmD [Geitlerinema sp. P-1104]|uniref:16S rRNA (guanine(966)-N(2))-methyltransferase RsmD n=1 Tax=Geitlerinema sp. P-1104 TaxID=2546230 RepID=UPI0014773A39|nr:16S rRNA (guanine(966)-N(2))-methyltransferase RsmD [Geitlerinema sp. P-1104]NMG57211.1 16S rRNA (guanine(966)-N(2))-methyltransferase RsmD [Geitlerinema sp. P-1104]